MEIDMRSLSKIKTVTALCLSCVFTSPTMAGDKALTVIAIDISGSSPFLVIDAAAQKLAQFTHSLIRKGKAGDEFQITTLGQSGFSAAIDIRAKIGTDSRSKARILAKGAAKLVADIPKKFRQKKIEHQGATSIIDFLENFDARICANRPTHIIIATDGVEYTNDFDGTAFSEGQIKLPKASGRFLDQCHVSMVGVGATLDGSSNGLYVRIAPQWKAFLTSAGAVQVDVLGTRFGE